MRLLLINPCNPAVSLAKTGKNRWNKYRIWKPLSLLVLSGQTSPEWETVIVDENLSVPDYSSMHGYDLVGITAFTSQATRGYEIASEWRARGVPVVMGGIHATMCLSEALERVDSVVTGEAEGIWPEVLKDAQRGRLQRHYAGSRVAADSIPIARHDLLPTGYHFGSIQTARGCPLNCSFCSVSAFSGRAIRRRPIDQIIEEFKLIRERNILVVDDNLIGTRGDHIATTKALFRAMIQADLNKKWIAQATINMADDEELLSLAAQAGCQGIFVGFETTTGEGLAEIRKNFNARKGRDFPASVRRIQRHGILVMGSFIIGLDVDRPGVGRQIADTATQYGLDNINVLFLTPLPGTRLWAQMETQRHICAHGFPEDWKYYTLMFPVGRYKHLTRDEGLREMDICNREYYSSGHILRRFIRSIRHRRKPILTLVSNLASRINSRLNAKSYWLFSLSHKEIRVEMAVPTTGHDGHVIARSVSRTAVSARERSGVATH